MPLQTRKIIIVPISIVNEPEQRERKGKKAAQSQEERAQAEEKGEAANVKEEERQQAQVTRRVTGTDAPYVDPPSAKAPR
jgi:hypothetical protein